MYSQFLSPLSSNIKALIGRAIVSVLLTPASFGHETLGKFVQVELPFFAVQDGDQYAHAQMVTATQAGTANREVSH